ncbi:MAG: choice-of-anchor tandem repeat GloVer-containing protein [Steroidobacteraceae bacterium]|jgi:uncharacterized repeat protein (TIGR03803 family)
MRKNLTRGLWTPLLCIGMLLLSGCGHGSAITGPGSGSSTACTACSVGGTVTGLSANESVTLLNNGGDSLTANTDGTFMFSSALAGGSRYDVTVQSHTPGISCAVSNGAGTVGTHEVANILVNCAAGTETVLYAFAGGPTDGADPQGTLALGSSGTLYGTTYRGGANGLGTVYQLSSAGGETVLYAFAGGASDGADPRAGPILGSSGTLYGTTYGGGADGLGTVYQLSSAGGETVLYSFAGGASDGADPRGSLIIDSAGNLYGTTSGGGASGLGTVYEVSPTGAQTVLYSFAGGTTDGEVPLGHLVMGSGGSLYGTTSTGGAYDLGTVFRISLGGVETVLYSFAGTTIHDGAYPRAGLIMDGSGDLYGTTSAGGTYDLGTVFEISTSGTETVLHSFAGGTSDGSDPNGGLLLGSSGSLYGTTSTGGAYDLGTVFKLSSDGTEVLLHSFAGGTTDGSSPKAGLIVDSAGNLYGTTSAGGVNDDGTVFELN